MRAQIRFIYSTLMCVLLASATQADVLLFENFEDNSFAFTTSQPLFHDGASDYFHIVPLNGAAAPVDPYTGFQGTNFFAVEDIDDGGTRPSQGILTFTLSGMEMSNLTVDLLFAAGGNLAGTPAYDSDDGFLLRASLNGGGTWQNLLAFEATGVTNQQLRQDTNFDGIGDGFLPTSGFTAFNGLSITGTTSDLLLQVIFDSNDGNTEMAIDNFRVNGTVTAIPEPTSLGLVGIVGAILYLRRRRSRSVAQ